MEVSQNGDDWELQQLRAECEMHKEEIRQLMEQVMTPDAELERESLFRETMERNTFLEKCLNKAESRLIRAKVVLDHVQLHISYAVFYRLEVCVRCFWQSTPCRRGMLLHSLNMTSQCLRVNYVLKQ